MSAEQDETSAAESYIPPFRIGDTVYAVEAKQERIECPVCLNGRRFGTIKNGRDVPAIKVLDKLYPCPECHGLGFMPGPVEYVMLPVKIVQINMTDRISNPIPEWRFMVEVTEPDGMVECEWSMQAFPLGMFATSELANHAIRRLKVSTRQGAMFYGPE